MYSYLHSRYANKQDNIRVVSIGTGEQAAASLDPDNVNKIDWAMQIGTLLTVVEANTHDYLMK